MGINLLSGPFFRITPELACRFSSSDIWKPEDMDRFIGEVGLDLDWGCMNGLETSPAIGLVYEAPLRVRDFEGEANDTLLIPDISDGVRGVFVTERDRRLGVLGV